MRSPPATTARVLSRLVGADVAAMAAGFASSIVVARALGPSGRGVVALVTVSTVLCAGVASLPVANAIALDAARRARAAAAAALAWTFLIGPIGAIAWALLGLLAHDWWKLSAGEAVGLTAAGWFVVCAVNLLRGVLVGEGRFRPVAVGRLCFAVVLLSGNLLLALADALTAARSIAILFGALTLQALVYWWALERPLRLRLSAPTRARNTAYAARAVVGVLAQTVLGRVDLILVGAFLGVTDAGHYAVALVLAEAGWLAVDGIGLFMLGGAAGGHIAVQRAAWATRVTIAFGLAASAALAVAALPGLPLVFGDEFDASYLPLAAMLPGVIAYGAWRVLMSDAAGRDRPELQSLSAGVGAVLLTVLCLLLIPLGGTVGAGCATSVAYLVTAGIGMLGYSRRFGVPVAQLLALRQGDIAVVREGLART